MTARFAGIVGVASWLGVKVGDPSAASLMAAFALGKDPLPAARFALRNARIMANLREKRTGESLHGELDELVETLTGQRNPAHSTPGLGPFIEGGCSMLVVRRASLDAVLEGGAPAFAERHDAMYNGDLVVMDQMAAAYHDEAIEEMWEAGLRWDDDFFLFEDSIFLRPTEEPVPTRVPWVMAWRWGDQSGVCFRDTSEEAGGPSTGSRRLP